MQNPDLEAGSVATIEMSSLETPAVASTSSLSNQDRSGLRRRQNNITSPVTTQPQPPNPFRKLSEALNSQDQNHCFFLCFPKSSSEILATAIPVGGSDSEDDMDKYDRIRALWKLHCGWQRYLPFYGIVAFEEVRIQFLQKDADCFTVATVDLDIREKVRMYHDLLANVRRKLASTSADDEKLHDFLSYKQRSFREQLLKLSLSPIPLLCLRDPKIGSQGLFRSGLKSPGTIYDRDKIDMWFFPGEDNEIYGWKIRSGWPSLPQISTFRAPTPLTAKATASIVVVAWGVATGMWDAAFAAGAFILMILHGAYAK